MESSFKSVFNKHLLRYFRAPLQSSFFTSLKKTLSLYSLFGLCSLGDQGLHIGDWNNLQAGCPHPAEKGRAAEEKGQRGPGTETGTEWGAQTGQVGQNESCIFELQCSWSSSLARVTYAHGWYYYMPAILAAMLKSWECNASWDDHLGTTFCASPMLCIYHKLNKWTY